MIIFPAWLRKYVSFLSFPSETQDFKQRLDREKNSFHLKGRSYTAEQVSAPSLPDRFGKMLFCKPSFSLMGYRSTQSLEQVGGGLLMNWGSGFLWVPLVSPFSLCHSHSVLSEKRHHVRLTLHITVVFSKRSRRACLSRDAGSAARNKQHQDKKGNEEEEEEKKKTRKSSGLLHR